VSPVRSRIDAAVEGVRKVTVTVTFQWLLTRASEKPWGNKMRQYGYEPWKLALVERPRKET
jgi:hypothetical protein